MKAWLIIFPLIISSCTFKQKSPEEALNSFLDARLEKSTAKEKLLTLTSGELYETLNSMTQEEYEEYQSRANFEKKDMKIMTKDCTETECSMTYVAYLNSSPKAETASNMEVKNVAHLIFESGSWKIERLNPVKTYIELTKPITP